MPLSSYLRAAALSLMLTGGVVTLASCDHLFHKEQVKKPKKKAKAGTDKAAKEQKTAPSAESYFRLVAQAQPALGGSAEESADAMRLYCTQRPDEAQPVKLVLLDYQNKDGGAKSKIIAPADASAASRRVLADIMKRMDAQATLHEIRVMHSELTNCTVPEDADALPDFVSDQVTGIADRAAVPEASDEVKTQLSLIGFFTDQRLRDAAYLSVDNAKRLLAKLSQGQGGGDTSVRALSRQLETQEERLRKEIPFTL